MLNFNDLNNTGNDYDWITTSQAAESSNEIRNKVQIPSLFELDIINVNNKKVYRIQMSF